MIYSIGSEGDQERSWRRRSSDPDRDCGNDRRDVRWLREGPWQKESSQVFATFDAKAIHIWWQFYVHFWIRILSLASNMQQGHFLFPQATIPSWATTSKMKELSSHSLLCRPARLLGRKCVKCNSTYCGFAEKQFCLKSDSISNKSMRVYNMSLCV